MSQRTATEQTYYESKGTDFIYNIININIGYILFTIYYKLEETYIYI